MKFNNKLLKNCSNPELAKLLLFCIKEKINIDSFLEVDDGRLVLMDDLFEERQKTTIELNNNGSLELDYMSEPARYAVLGELYVTEQELNKADYERIVKLWKSENCGIKGKSVGIKAGTNIIDKFLEKHPHFTLSQIEKACKGYIRSVSNPEYIVLFHNFFSREEGANCLIAWLENSKTRERLTRTV